MYTGEKPRPPTRISILSHRCQPWGSGNRTDSVCNRDSRGKKKKGEGEKKKEKRKRRVHRNVGKTEIKFGAERRRKKERERRGKARESGERKIGRGEKGKEMGKT